MLRPRNKDRQETLSTRDYVFKEVDDSVLSIVPSRLSSRLSCRLSFRFSKQFSVVNSETSSIRSNASSLFHYIPLSFENALFTSYVYKRNYRSPFQKRVFRSTTKGEHHADAPLSPPRSFADSVSTEESPWKPEPIEFLF